MLFWRAWTHLSHVLIQMLHELQLNFHKVCKRKSGTPGFMPHLLNPLGLHTDCYRYSATFKHKFKMCITHNTVCEIQDQRMDRQENQNNQTVWRRGNRLNKNKWTVFLKRLRLDASNRLLNILSVSVGQCCTLCSGNLGSQTGLTNCESERLLCRTEAGQPGGSSREEAEV